MLQVKVKKCWRVLHKSPKSVLCLRSFDILLSNGAFFTFHVNALLLWNFDDKIYALFCRFFVTFSLLECMKVSLVKFLKFKIWDEIENKIFERYAYIYVGWNKRLKMLRMMTFGGCIRGYTSYLKLFSTFTIFSPHIPFVIFVIFRGCMRG